MVTSEDTQVPGTRIFGSNTHTWSGGIICTFHLPRHQRQAGNFEVFLTPHCSTSSRTMVLNLLILFGFKWTGDTIVRRLPYLFVLAIFFSVFLKLLNKIYLYVQNHFILLLWHTPFQIHMLIP